MMKEVTHPLNPPPIEDNMISNANNNITTSSCIRSQIIPETDVREKAKTIAI